MKKKKKQVAEGCAQDELVYKKLGKKKLSKIQHCIVLGKYALMTKLFLQWGTFRKVVPPGDRKGVELGKEHRSKLLNRIGNAPTLEFSGVCAEPFFKMWHIWFGISQI